jgi:ATP-dependent Clp protease ATP-binding subunit ClpC
LTDIENSMLVKQRYGDIESAKIFRTHDSLIREILATHRDAREIKTIGDSFLLAFTSKESAVHFALVLQFRLRCHKDLSMIPLQVRIGVFAGQLLEKATKGSSLSDPIFGISIDITARIASLAVGNQILTNRGVYECTAEDLVADATPGLGEIGWRCHGEYLLKGLDAPVEIFEVGEVGKAAFARPSGHEKGGPIPFDLKGTVKRTEGTSAHRSGSLVARLGKDLTALAKQGRLAPVVGRTNEMKALVRYLQRTTKRNVIIIGQAGVGKTAVVEGLAQRLVARNAPEFLQKTRIVQISIADLVAGTRYRGDMEERIREMTAEAVADPNLVLFLDEIHLLMKAGSGEGSPDLADLLKPALTRDDFRCIGSTTTKDYERCIKNDAAFARRFQILHVGEPSEQSTLQICRAWARRIEALQQVVFNDDAITAAVTLSARHIIGRALPDKAIDLLENAAAYVKVSSLSVDNRVPTKELPRVEKEHIETVLEEQAGISVSVSRVLGIGEVETILQRELVGQNHMITALVETLGALAAKKDAASRPLGVLLFTGPTGVGKTFAAECLGRALFGAEGQALCRFNMNEFKERHEIARLIGAPPGFVGHELRGALFRFIEEHPQGLILLDEMEKAHPEIQDYFLQVFDKGEATDSRGHKADFRNYIFVMTCNVVPTGNKRHEIGFRPHKGKTTVDQSAARDNQLLQHFRREFLARVDRILQFRSLTDADYQALFDRRFLTLAAEVRHLYGASLELTEDAIRQICQSCSNQQDGARGFNRLLEHTLVMPLFDHLKTVTKRDVVRVGWAEERLVLF